MSAGLAHLGAIQEGANVIRRGVPATFLKAVSEGLGADPVTLQTFLDALLHIHDGSPSLDFESTDEDERARCWCWLGGWIRARWRGRGDTHNRHVTGSKCRCADA